MAAKTKSYTELTEELSNQVLKAEATLLESAMGLLDNDPTEDLFWDRLDSQGNRWYSIGGHHSPTVPFTSVQELGKIRNAARLLSVSNPYAINLLENRVNYVVGNGMSYKFVGKDDTDSSAKIAEALNDYMDKWLEDSLWSQKEQEIVRRGDRDGEVFIRIFFPEKGGVQLRFNEPETVFTPDTLDTVNHHSFGIETNEDDVQDVISYHMHASGYEQVDAEEVIHIKLNVDENTKRGLSTLYGSKTNLDRAVKLLKNMSVVTALQSSIAMIRKHATKKVGIAKTFVDGRKDFSVTDSRTGREDNFEKVGEPKIIDVDRNKEYEFPAMGVDPSKIVASLQAELRAVAARVQMPEFMLSADASNANYSSTMIAEGPAVRSFSRLQNFYIPAFKRIIIEVILTGLEENLIGSVDPELIYGRDSLLDVVKLDIQPPNLIVRDALKEAQKNQILSTNNVLSIQQWTAIEGYDYETEQTNIEEHTERRMDSMTPELMAAFGTDPASEGEEDGTDDPESSEGGSENTKEKDDKTKKAKKDDK